MWFPKVWGNNDGEYVSRFFLFHLPEERQRHPASVRRSKHDLPEHESEVLPSMKEDQHIEWKSEWRDS